MATHQTGEREYPVDEHHCPDCGKLRLTRSGAPHKCPAPELARWRILEAALNFYADQHNYGIGGGNSQKIYADGGRIARHALCNLPQPLSPA